MSTRIGANISGGNAVFNGPVAGHIDMRTTEPRRPSRADIGVLTVLAVEMRAVTAEFQRMNDYRKRTLDSGPTVHEAWLPAASEGRRRVAAMQTLKPGTESAALAYSRLIDEFNPSTVLLVGIAGGVSEKVRIGDVVISDQVIAYDARKLTPEGTLRRGQAQDVAAALGHRLNDFFTDVPDAQPAIGGGTFRIFRGPIGSGNAVVADRDAEVRDWLRRFHEEVLAVETEAAGVAQSFHEKIDRDNTNRGWLSVRGISDTADTAKNDDDQPRAAIHAAAVMVRLMPFL
jgi:adenosylhomocysteine nucleosidase